MRKKLALIMVLAMIMTSFAGCGGTDKSKDGESTEKKAVVVKIGYENNPGEPIDLACQKWKEVLEDISGGEMEVQLYPSSQLGSKNDIIDQMLAGDNVITLADGAFTADRGTPDMGIQFAPFLFDSYDEAWKLVESDWWAGQSDALAEKGLKIVTANFVYGTRNILTKKPVNNVNDLKGMKIRVPNNTIQIKGIEALGASPTPMPLGDVYSGLQQGTIDGVENPAAALYSLGFYEVAKYLILDAHVLNTTLWLAGTEWFDTLTKEQQGWLEEAANEAGLLSQDLDKKMEAEAIQKLKDNGVTVYTPTKEDMEGFKAASMSFYEYPEIKAMFSPDLYDEIIKAIGRTPE